MIIWMKAIFRILTWMEIKIGVSKHSLRAKVSTRALVLWQVNRCNPSRAWWKTYWTVRWRRRTQPMKAKCRVRLKTLTKAWRLWRLIRMPGCWRSRASLKQGQRKVRLEAIIRQIEIEEPCRWIKLGLVHQSIQSKMIPKMCYQKSPNKCRVDFHKPI